MLCGYDNDSCYLKFNIGMKCTKKPVDVREVKIRNFKEIIYLPPENYYACEVLPEDWIDIIPSIQKPEKPSPNKYAFDLEQYKLKHKTTLFKTYSKR